MTSVLDSSALLHIHHAALHGFGLIYGCIYLSRVYIFSGEVGVLDFLFPGVCEDIFQIILFLFLNKLGFVSLRVIISSTLLLFYSIFVVLFNSFLQQLTLNIYIYIYIYIYI